MAELTGRALQLAIVAEARGWLGTPFFWGQAVRGQGCDCKGLIAGVARDCGLAEGNSVEAIAVDYRGPHPGRLARGLDAIFARVTAIDPGDVVAMKVGGRLQHLGIASGEGTIIHSFGRRVEEQPIDAVLAIWPLHSIRRWRGAVA